MQVRMRNNQLSQQEIGSLLDGGQVASMATINSDGTPYVTPIHYVYMGGAVYIHGLAAGQKYDNIIANPAVSLTVYNMAGLIMGDSNDPCSTNTRYNSIIMTGHATIVEDIELKRAALTEVVRKYTPHLDPSEMTDRRINGTAVIKVTVLSMTGKHFG